MPPAPCTLLPCTHACNASAVASEVYLDVRQVVHVKPPGSEHDASARWTLSLRLGTKVLSTCRPCVFLLIHSCDTSCVLCVRTGELTGAE